MAYRIEENITWKDMWKNLNTFLSELTTIEDISYASSSGDGTLTNLSVPQATATTETWSLVCTNDTVPATFSVTGTVTGSTADATVDSAYDNGIIKFTLVAGAVPWAVNDVISFSSIATTAPAWIPLTVEGKLMESITKFYYEDGTVVPQRGYFRKQDGPKADSKAFTAYKSAINEDFVEYQTYNGARNGYAVLGTIFDPYSDYAHNNTQTRSITYWAKHINSLWCGAAGKTTQYGTAICGWPSNSSYYAGWLGIGHTGYSIQLYGPSTSIYQGFTGEIAITSNIYQDNNIAEDDWILYTITRESTGLMRIYMNDVLLSGSYTHIDSYLKVRSITPFFPVSDIRLWDHVLTAAEITTILNNTDAPYIDGPEILEGITYKDEDVLYWPALSNVDSNGNDISAVFTPQNGPYNAYHLSAAMRGLPIKGDVTENEMLWFEREDSLAIFLTNDYPSSTPTYMLGGDSTQVVAKSWFVATNDFIIVAYKIYDPTTSQQLPVYQIGYIGNTNTSEEMEYKAVIGTFSSASDYWYTSNTALRSGIFYSANARFASLGSYAAPTNIYYSPITGGFLDLNNSYNIYPVLFYNSSYARNYGELHNLWGVQTRNVNLEDEFIIDGERYIALGDGTRAGSNSLILLKLA